MREVGIYIDEKKVSVAVSERGRFLLSKSIVLPEIKEGENLEELKAIIMRIFEETSVDTNKVSVGLSGKNIIFRLLNLPLLNRRELEAALPLEAEKYVPFRMKEIVWGYRYKKDFHNHQIYLAFLAERKNIVENYIALFGSLGVRIDTLESGFLSLFSFLVSRKYIPSNVPAAAFVNFSSTDMEIAIFEKQFPYFSRYSKLLCDELGNVDNAKIMDEIVLTFDYYKRKFHREITPVLFIAAAKELVDTAEAVKNSISQEVKIFTPAEIMPEVGFEDFEAIKAFSLVARNIPRKQRVFLNIPVAQEEEREEFALPTLPPLNPLLIIVEVVIGIGLLGFLLFRYSRQEGKAIAELRKVTKNFVDNYKEYKDIPYSQIKKSDEEYSEKIKALEEADSLGTAIHKYLDVIASALTSGLWLQKMDIVNSVRGSFIVMKGYVFLDDGIKERKSVGDFLLNLRNNGFIKSKESYVNLNLVARGKLENFAVTRFKIEIRSKNDRL